VIPHSLVAVLELDDLPDGLGFVPLWAAVFVFSRRPLGLLCCRTPRHLPTSTDFTSRQLKVGLEIYSITGLGKISDL
jgi:hypothetical protein